MGSNMLPRSLTISHRERPAGILDGFVPCSSDLSICTTCTFLFTGRIGGPRGGPGSVNGVYPCRRLFRGAVEFPFVYGSPSHRKPRPPISLCRIFDEKAFRVYRENYPYVAAWISVPSDAHRLTYALSLHRLS